MSQVRKEYGFEGEVMYFVDKKDHVIGLLKKKTAWYILARAIREKASAAVSAFSKGDYKSFVLKRYQSKSEVLWSVVTAHIRGARKNAFLIE